MACRQIVNSLQMTRPFSLLLMMSLIISSSELNSNLAKMSEWAFKWKMSFNPDPAKLAQEALFVNSSSSINNI